MATNASSLVRHENFMRIYLFCSLVSHSRGAAEPWVDWRQRSVYGTHFTPTRRDRPGLPYG
ncbi:unnamed protein product [Penicillium roqueforti FM164]|uniref:Genomic scaffold, ProqFM164S01 n=1 Tax=Penicillium roqueforti (strain FM164) TaxID=1365484 RepID=W6PTX0_PENRF|nr:unnamed protein product [Penicillium roqueforti FM164]